MASKHEIYRYISEILGYGGLKHAHVDTVIKKMGDPSGLPTEAHVWATAQAFSKAGVY